MKKLFLLLFITGCSSTQLKETNTLYEGVHDVRMVVESIPLLTTAVDAYWPWMTGVRVGLNETYALKHALVPDTKLSETNTAETK